MEKCSRCKKETKVFTYSYFNTDLICLDCSVKEKKHHLFKKACDVEIEEVRKGNYNYEGIGLPDDLK